MSILIGIGLVVLVALGALFAALLATLMIYIIRDTWWEMLNG